jgi:hypothetical protein
MRLKTLRSGTFLTDRENREILLKTLKRATTVLFLALLVANPAYAEFQGCPNPTAETRALLDQCSDSALCRAAVSVTRGCTSLVNAISSFFRQPPLDPGEYNSERYAPPGPSELEQARKNNELYQQNKRLSESESRQAYNELVVSDRSIKARLGSYCGNPLDQGCKDAVHDAESLANKVNTYNSNPDFVELRGKLTAESPGIAAPYAKAQEKAWEETQKMKEAHNKNMREMDEKRQKLLGAGKNSDSETIKRNLATVEQQEREQIRAAAVAEQERLALEQRERNRLAAQQRAQEQDSGSGLADLIKGLGAVAEAYAKSKGNGGSSSPGGSAASGPGPSGTEDPARVWRNRCGGTIPLPATYRCGGGGTGTAN